MRLKTGKIPVEILEKIVFKHLGSKINGLILGPSKGEDAAVIRVGKKLFALSCDPISGAVKNIGWFAINICCNDVAVMGVQPKWFLGCLMLPKNATQETIRKICSQMDKAAKKIGVGIIGGHCEITPNLNYPLVVGFCMGEIKNGKITPTSNVKVKDKIVLTKTVGIEGTAILAFDKENVLRKKFGLKFVREAQTYLKKISIVQEALEASKINGIHAMHDPTEGGLLGGLWEMAEASNKGFKIYEEKIPVAYHTKEICKFFRINPLKLISSGCLLLSVQPTIVEKLLKKFRQKRIQATIIGEILENKNVKLVVGKNGKIKSLKKPPQDELWVALKR